tara:strand:- start:1115 stop:1498 length:384 start_codon:yes stop_codon:yes gene_type:complete
MKTKIWNIAWMRQHKEIEDLLLEIELHPDFTDRGSIQGFAMDRLLDYLQEKELKGELKFPIDMKKEITLSTEDLVELLWGICLSDHLGDVMRSLGPIKEALELEKWGQEDLLEEMKQKDLIPEYQRD